MDKLNYQMDKSSLDWVACRRSLLTHHPIVVDIIAEEDIPTFIFGAIDDDGMYIVWCNDDDDAHNQYVNYQVHNDDDWYYRPSVSIQAVH